MNPQIDSPLVQAFWTLGRVAECPILDTHAHYGPFNGIYFPERGEAEAMLSLMDRFGVQLAVVSGHAALVDPVRGNNLVAALVAAHPDRFRGYLVINPNYPAQVAHDLATFELWQAKGFVGFKLHPGMHDYVLTGPNYQPVLAFANERRIPILSHTWGADGTCGTRQVKMVVERYPDLPFLAGHACYGNWDAAIELAREHKNLYLELTAAYAVGGVIEHMVEGVGASKILFGNDLPWFDTAHALGCVLCAYITDDDRRAILYRNAQALFKLA